MTRKDFLKMAGLTFLGSTITSKQVPAAEIEDFDYRSIAERLEITEVFDNFNYVLVNLAKSNRHSYKQLSLFKNYDLWMDEAIGKNAVKLYSYEVSHIHKNTTYTFVHSPDSNEKFKFSKNQYNKIHKELVDRKLIKATDKIRIGFNNNFPLQYAQHKEFYNIVFTYGAVNYEII